MTKIEEYIKFLMDIVDTKPKDYSKLFKELLGIKFMHFVGNDVDRAKDGLELRFRFEEEYGKLYELEKKLEGECSILEAFVALAERCERDIMCDFDCGDRTSEWFWVIMDNLGLSTFTNSSFNSDEIWRICEIFNLRKYGKSGKNGGAFPLKRRHLDFESDVREVELWYQMNWYLTENYEI